ncbi:MAG: DUF2069 domain-containing protein [Casimicrobiaceae bacterium]
MSSARVCTAALLALVILLVLWESVLAPLRPGSGWLALKALPLALLLPGTMRGVRRARQWLALLLPFYAAEGCVRAVTEHGRHALVAALAATLAVATFIALLAWFRAERARA